MLKLLPDFCPYKQCCCECPYIHTFVCILLFPLDEFLEVVKYQVKGYNPMEMLSGEMLHPRGKLCASLYSPSWRQRLFWILLPIFEALPKGSNIRSYSELIEIGFTFKQNLLQIQAEFWNPISRYFSNVYQYMTEWISKWKVFFKKNPPDY